jgi:diguanylate cyclase (GGDEF)-like protein
MNILDVKKATVLIIDDSPVNTRLLREALQDEHQIIVATSREEALNLAFNHPPDLIFLDIEIPENSGYKLFSELKEDPRTREIPIIVITAMSDGLYETACLELGAIDFIKKPFNPRLVKLRVHNHIELKMLRDYYKDMSCIDEMTKLPNRRKLKEFMSFEWKRLGCSQPHLSVIMIDIDHFKQYNDNYGHLVGDECLKQISQALLQANTRSQDLLARFGGEEFIFVLPGTDRLGAITVGEKLCDTISTLSIPHEHSEVADHVTISLGAATVTSSREYGSPDELIAEADKNLYLAKSQGRNQIVG